MADHEVARGYPFPWRTAFHLIRAIVFRRGLSFRQEALTCARLLDGSLCYEGLVHIPAAGGYAITVNHYSRPGLPAWWIALVVSAAVSDEVHWIITEAWTFPGHPLRGLLEPLSRIILLRIAKIFDFSPMPPMPPRSHEVERRARAVRSVLRRVKVNPLIIILGVSPEGRDPVPGKERLADFPPGVGRFLLHLSRQGLAFLPVAVFERGDHLVVNFRPPYRLDPPRDIAPDNCDSWASDRARKEIQACLLRYNFSSC